MPSLSSSRSLTSSTPSPSLSSPASHTPSPSKSGPSLLGSELLTAQSSQRSPSRSPHTVLVVGSGSGPAAQLEPVLAPSQMPSLSSSSSQPSPVVSVSELAWSTLGSVGQLSGPAAHT